MLKLLLELAPVFQQQAYNFRRWHTESLNPLQSMSRSTRYTKAASVPRSEQYTIFHAFAISLKINLLTKCYCLAAIYEYFLLRCVFYSLPIRFCVPLCASQLFLRSQNALVQSLESFCLHTSMVIFHFSLFAMQAFWTTAPHRTARPNCFFYPTSSGWTMGISSMMNKEQNIAPKAATEMCSSMLIRWTETKNETYKFYHFIAMSFFIDKFQTFLSLLQWNLCLMKNFANGAFFVAALFTQGRNLWFA